MTTLNAGQQNIALSIVMAAVGEAYEACAKIADERKYKGSGATTVRVCNDIAAAIRRLSSKGG